MTAARAISIGVGGGETPLAPDSVVEALFATISYRLEPNGWATRFPTVLDRLREGRLDATSADKALAELEQIAGELRKVPADRVVWSMQDLRRRDDSREPVRRDAPSAYEYFVARDGRPILAVMTEAVQKSRMSGEGVLLGSATRHKNVVSGIVLFVFGALVAVVCFLYFPDLILVPDQAPANVTQHGPLVWPLGATIAVAGLFATIGGLYPAFAVWLRSHRRLVGIVSVLLFGAVAYASWR